MPEILKIVKARGVAGQVSYTATVQYEGEDPTYASFVGQEGERGPVVMVTAGNPGGCFVSDPGRFGVFFGSDWVKAFFA